jgi:hypothetical protein
MIKNIFCITFILTSFNSIQAQPVARKVVVEHFTNTYCSVCASRNPGYHKNLFTFPQVVHVSYFPSAPYSGCPINQENKTEHDARTNFYGIYGATPRIVIQGKVIPASADYEDTALFYNELNKTSPFQVLSALKLSGSSIELTIRIIKKDTSSLTMLDLNAALVEDTMMFAAKNGEKTFYHVFKKNFSGTAALPVKMPASVGDTVTQVLSVPLNADWKQSRLFAVSTVQDAGKNIVQADASGYLEGVTAIPLTPARATLKVFPNPAHDYLYLEGYAAAVRSASVYDMAGRQLPGQEIEQGKVNITQLIPGRYWLYLNESGQSVRFIKK